MAAVTSILIGAAAVAGVAGTALQVNESRRNARQQREQLAQQETEARNAAALETTREDTGATVKLGSRDASTGTRRTTGQQTTARTGTVSNSVGGLGASASLGL